jgi:hypothetical protein
LLFSHLLSDAQRAWLSSLDAGHLSHEESMALVTCRETGEVRNASLRHLTGLDTLKASSVLRGLCDRGSFIAQGAGAATSYVLAAAGARPLVAELCTIRPFSRIELAVLLKRKDAGHLSRLLSALVLEGTLEMTNPKPNAPHQTYRRRTG